MTTDGTMPEAMGDAFIAAQKPVVVQERCPYCEGSGDRVVQEVPSGYAVLVLCFNCRGSGHVSVEVETQERF